MNFLGFLQQTFSQMRWQDAIDIFCVFLVVYRLLLLIKGTRAVQILTGLGIVFIAFILSDRLQLFVINFLLKQFIDFSFLIVVILFQDEIRRALANIGRNPFLSGAVDKDDVAEALDDVVQASTLLASKRIGALIVLERQHGLKNYSEGSTLMDAHLSAELLLSIFQPSSPIHDGAVIIRGDKITAAGCFVPVTLENNMDRNLGTRHRAAVGLTQETDAIVIVMSEERGEISLVEFGEISRGLNANELKRRLYLAFDLVPDNSDAGGSNAG